MEQCVVDPEINKVLIVSDKAYAERANSRQGGVGTESQIISPKVYSSVKSTKFIPLVLEFDANGDAILPAYLQSRNYFNFSAQSQYSSEFEALVRDIFDRPRKQKPKLGKPPSYLGVDNAPSAAIFVAAREAQRAIKTGSPNISGALLDLTELAKEYLLSLYLDSPDGDKVMDSVNSTREIRDLLVTVFSDAIKYGHSSEMSSAFSAMCSSVCDSLLSQQSLEDSGWDAGRFLMQELIIYFAAVYDRAVDYSGLERFCSETFGRKYSGRWQWVRYSAFQLPVRSLDIEYNSSHECRKVSMVSSKIKDRLLAPLFTQERIIQADLLLSLRSIMKGYEPQSYHSWKPVTTLWDFSHNYDLPLFSKMKATGKYEALKPLLGFGDRPNFEKYGYGCTCGIRSRELVFRRKCS